jgi:succinate dehydrogenase/fumarate reductase flavoprotein subunit
MAGLAAAARARERGARPVVHEKGSRAGGSMLLSSCVVWRYRDWETFRAECPDGDPALQRRVLDELDDALTWLRSLGAPAVREETENPLTTGVRFDPVALTDVLVRAAGEVRLRRHVTTCDEGRTILATGGFQGSAELVAEFVAPAAPLRVRANPWSEGDGLRLARARGAALSRGMDEFYGRNMPDRPFDESELVPSSQLYARHARVFNASGEEIVDGEVHWSENDVAQLTARQPGAVAYYVLDERAAAEPDVAGRVRLSRTEVPLDELPFDPPADAVAAVRVAASITHTIGGLRIDERARVLDEDGQPVDGLFAAGADAGGISTGGYASGLAAALVFGRIAAETALSS